MKELARIRWRALVVWDIILTQTFVRRLQQESNVMAAPEIKLEKAAWRGKNEFYERLIAELERYVGKKWTEVVAAPADYVSLYQ